MMKTALLAAIGVLVPLGFSSAYAQDVHRSRPHSGRHATTRVPDRHRPEMQYDRRHCERCVRRTERRWIDAPRYERTLSGHDGWGSPSYRTTIIPGGYWSDRTTYSCR